MSVDITPAARHLAADLANAEFGERAKVYAAHDMTGGVFKAFASEVDEYAEHNDEAAEYLDQAIEALSRLA